MKYIRTKTKIETIETKLDNKELFDYLKQFDNYKDDLIKVADTIEELCDLIFCWQGKQWGFFMPIELEMINKEKWDKIYGAIFTDKGLIYVAKMNDEGELELL